MAKPRLGERNKGVELACRSLIVSTIYDKLNREGRIGQLIGIIQICSGEGYDMKKTIDVILKHFKGYITKEELTEETFKVMLQGHIDIAEAWGFGGMGEKVRDMMIRNRAFELASKAETIDTIETYRRIYDGGDLRPQDMRQVVNFNIQRK